tara:strand:+ start:1299 stop:1649 length:351 start_codon:yes stop_codon:yes gene_type:complete
MPKEQWGTKRVCPKCSMRFYDLNKDPITCPSCEFTFDLTSVLETFKKPARETASRKEEEIVEINPILESDDLESDAIILEGDDNGIEMEDELLEEEDEDSVSLEELADVATDNEDT